jgi:hypothetical protein
MRLDGRGLTSDQMKTNGYNYDHFDEYVASGQDQVEFSAFPDHLHAGDPAPDAALTRLEDRTEVRLSEMWAVRNLVIEFGSYT